MRDIQVVGSDDQEALLPEADRDLCALVTCAPYGVNTHRLLVTGERCEVDGTLEVPDAGLSPHVNMRTAPLMAAIAFLLALMVVAVVVRAARGQRRPSGSYLD